MSLTLAAVIIGTTHYARAPISVTPTPQQRTLLADDSNIPSVTASPADSFVDSLGLGTHFMWPPISSQKIYDAYTDLGIRYMRDDFAVSYDTYVQQGSQWITRLQHLKQLGVSTLAISSVYTVTPSDVLRYIHAANDAVPGTIYAIDGPNEVDNGCSPDTHVFTAVIWNPCTPLTLWQKPTESYMQQLHSAMASDSTAKSMSLYSPSLGLSSFGLKSTIKDNSTYANIHYYPIYTTPWMNDSIENELAGAAQFYGSTKPVVMTEVGYPSVSLDSTKQTSEALQAKMLPLYYLAAYKAGIARTFLYQLVDAGGPNDYWGLMASDGRKKPSYYAIKELTSTLADPGPAFVPGALQYRVTDTTTPDGVSSQLFQKRDGTYYIMLWQTHDTDSPAPTTTTAGAHDQTATIDFGGSIASADLTNIAQAAGVASEGSQSQNYSSPTSISVRLSDSPVMIKVTPAVVTTPTPNPNPTPTPTPVPTHKKTFTPPAATPPGAGKTQPAATPAPTPPPSAGVGYSGSRFYAWWQVAMPHLQSFFKKAAELF